MGRRHKTRAKRARPSSGTKRVKKTVADGLSLENVDNSMKTVDIDGETAIVVECGQNTAHLFVEKLCQGSKGQCIRFHDTWLTPNEFQLISGRECAKDWKRSIKHDGKQLKYFFSSGDLTVHKNSCGCVAGRTLPSCFRRSPENEQLMPIISKITSPKEDDNEESNDQTDANDDEDGSLDEDESDGDTEDENDDVTGNSKSENGECQTNGEAESDVETDQYSENEYESVVPCDKKAKYVDGNHIPSKGDDKGDSDVNAEGARQEGHKGAAPLLERASHKVGDSTKSEANIDGEVDGQANGNHGDTIKSVPRNNSEIVAPIKIKCKGLKSEKLSHGRKKSSSKSHKLSAEVPAKKSAIDVYEFCDDATDSNDSVKPPIQQHSPQQHSPQQHSPQQHSPVQQDKEPEIKVEETSQTISSPRNDAASEPMEVEPTVEYIDEKTPTPPDVSAEEPLSPDHIQMPTLEPECTRSPVIDRSESPLEDEPAPGVVECGASTEAIDFSMDGSKHDEAKLLVKNNSDVDEIVAPVLSAETTDEKPEANTYPERRSTPSCSPPPSHKESKLSSIIAELRTAKERQAVKSIDPNIRVNETQPADVMYESPSTSEREETEMRYQPEAQNISGSISDLSGATRIPSPSSLPCLDGMPPDLKEKFYSSCIKSELEAQCRKRMLAKSESKLVTTDNKDKRKAEKVHLNHNIPGANTVRQQLNMRKHSQTGREYPTPSTSSEVPTKLFQKNDTGKQSPSTGKTAEDTPAAKPSMNSYDDYMKALAGIKPSFPMMTPEKLASRIPTAPKGREQQAPSLAQQQAYAILLEQLKSQEAFLQQGLYAQMLGMPFPMHSLPFVAPGMFMPQMKGVADASKRSDSSVKSETSVKSELMKKPTTQVRKSPEHERREAPAKRKVDCEETALDLSNKKTKTEHDNSRPNKQNCMQTSTSSATLASRGHVSESWTNHSSVGKAKGCTCNHNPKANMNNWDVQDVCRFIKNIPGCAPYVKQFQDHKVTGQSLPLLTSEQLTKCLKMTIGPALMLTRAVAQTISETRQLLNCDHCKNNRNTSVKVPAI